MSTQEWESTLIQRAKTGDQEAFTQLYESYAPAIYRYVYVRIGNAELAEDIRSDVFIRMLEGLDRYENRGRPMLAWLYRIAHDRMVDTLRRHQLRSHIPLENCSYSYDGPETTISYQFDIEQLHMCIRDLPLAQQEVIKLRFMAGMSVPQIAAKLGRSEGAVRGLQHRGLQALARLIETPSA